MSKWDNRFFDIAKLVASWSKDKSTKVGAVIVNDDRRILGTGYNGFPPGVNDDVVERHERPVKYDFTEHAEPNAIHHSIGDLKGSTIYVTHMPCAGCTRTIITAKISTIKFIEALPHWKKDSGPVMAMLKEVGIDLYQIDTKIETVDDIKW